MNLVDPKEIAAALAPILDTAEKNIAKSVSEAVASGMKQIDETVQKAMDRLHGIKINAEINLPPRAEGAQEK